MKLYPKKFEDLFTSDRSLRHCNLKKVKITDWEDEKKYSFFFGAFLIDAFSYLWIMSVKIYWLLSKFNYDGRTPSAKGKNGIVSDRAMSIYLRQYVGRDIRLITRSYFYSKLTSYFKDFFPDFYDNNPFDNPEFYKFPYKNISIDHIAVVYQMPERLEILDYADKKGLKYNEFLDFLFNYIFSYNREVGEEVFGFMNARSAPPYIKYFKDRDKNARRKKGKKA